MKKGIFILWLSFSGITAGAQNNVFSDGTSLSTLATLGIGKAKYWEQIKLYAHLEAEVRPASSRLSVAGTLLPQLNAATMYSLTDVNGNVHDVGGRSHYLLFGSYYHFLSSDSPVELFAGIQPGVAFLHTPNEVKLENDSSLTIQYGITAAPVASATAGAAWHGSYFKLFVQTKGIIGRSSNEVFRAPLREIMISFGLGLYLR